MLVRSRLPKLYGMAAIIVSVVVISMTSCTADEGPTAAQAGQTLKNHILQLLRERDAVDVQVADAGGENLPCGDSEAKQKFSATGADRSRETTPYILRTAMLGALGRVGDYKIVGAGDPNGAVRVVDELHKTILIIDSPASGIYSIEGETECLRIS